MKSCPSSSICEALSLPAHASVRDVIAVIDRGAAQIALVTDQDRLIGIITDGDVRRGLLRGESLDAPVTNIMRRDFRSLPANATAAEALALMQRKPCIRFLHSMKVAKWCICFCSRI